VLFSAQLKAAKLVFVIVLYSKHWPVELKSIKSEGNWPKALSFRQFTESFDPNPGAKVRGSKHSV